MNISEILQHSEQYLDTDILKEAILETFKSYDLLYSYIKNRFCPEKATLDDISAESGEFTFTYSEYYSGGWYSETEKYPIEFLWISDWKQKKKALDEEKKRIDLEYKRRIEKEIEEKNIKKQKELYLELKKKFEPE